MVYEITALGTYLVDLTDNKGKIQHAKHIKASKSITEFQRLTAISDVLNFP